MHAQFKTEKGEGGMMRRAIEKWMKTEIPMKMECCRNLMDHYINGFDFHFALACNVERAVPLFTWQKGRKPKMSKLCQSNNSNIAAFFSCFSSVYVMKIVRKKMWQSSCHSTEQTVKSITSVSLEVI